MKKAKSKNQKNLKKGIFKNKYITFIVIPIFVGLVVLLIGKLFSNENSDGNPIYNTTSNNQKGGVTAGHIENLNISNDPKNDLIGEKYFMSMNLFLSKFRMILYAYHIENNFVPNKTDKVFRVSNFGNKNSGGVLTSEINSELLTEIFNTYNFNQHTGLRFKGSKSYLPIGNGLHLELYLPNSLELKNGDTVTGFVWLYGELKDLQISCNDILSRYASVGDKLLIDDIEHLSNDIENLLKSHRLTRLPVYEPNDLQFIIFFFDRFVDSFKLSGEYRSK